MTLAGYYYSSLGCSHILRWMVLTSTVIVLKTMANTDWTQPDAFACGKDNFTLECEDSLVVGGVITAGNDDCMDIPGACFAMPTSSEFVDEIVPCLWKRSTCGPLSPAAFECRVPGCGNCQWIAAYHFECLKSTEVHNICDDQDPVITGQQGHVMSPGHPDLYHQNDCDKRQIHLDSDEALSVTSITVDMREDCEEDGTDYLRFVQFPNEESANAQARAQASSGTTSCSVCAGETRDEDASCGMERNCVCGEEPFNFTIPGPGIIVMEFKSEFGSLQTGFVFRFQVVPYSAPNDTSTMSDGGQSTTEEYTYRTSAAIQTTPTDDPSVGLPTTDDVTVGGSDVTKTPADEDDDDFWMYMFIGASVLAGILLICIIAICCKFYRTKRSTGSLTIEHMELQPQNPQQVTSPVYGKVNGTTPNGNHYSNGVAHSHSVSENNMSIGSDTLSDAQA